MKNEDLLYKFRKIHICFKANGDAHAKKFNLTQTQMHILHYLFDHSGNVTQRDIEKHLDMKHSTVIGILGRMEKNGFIEISVNKSDRRQRNIKLLKSAYDVRSDCEAEREYTETKLSSALTADELEELKILLDKVYNILKEDSKK